MCSEQTQRTGSLKVRQCKKEEENRKQISNRNKEIDLHQAKLIITTNPNRLISY